MVTVTVHVTHESGEYLENEIALPVLQKTPQSVGSSFTYGRRYTAAAMAGIAQEDDDGMGGGMGVPTGKAPPTSKTKPTKPGSEAPSTTEIPAEWKEPLDQLVAFTNECQTQADLDALMGKSQDFAKGVQVVRELARKAFLAKREALAAGAKK
jgi:hypothetical protein